MSNSISKNEYYRIMELIEKATTKSELETIRRILTEYDGEDEPQVKKLVLALRRK